MPEPIPHCPRCGAPVDVRGVCSLCATAVGTPAPTASAQPHIDLAAAPTRLQSPASTPDTPWSASSQARIGQVIGGRYQLVRPLGQGGMGEVLLAVDLELDQQVALKCLPAKFRDDPSLVARLREEVKLARRVSHVNVCRVHDLVELGGQWFLSMEYVDGEDLASLLQRIGRLAPEKATDIAHQLCRGLQAAHEQGVVHRDLKPANVMLDRQGRVKLTDFGLATLGHDIEHGRIREGTLAYMAPEQLAGTAVTRASDIYALGLVLYELFTGKRAHPGRRAADTRPRSPSAVIKELDAEVERVILRCLEWDPNDRPASVPAVAAGLPGGDPIAAALAAGELPSPEMIAASGHQRPMSWRVAGALLVAIAACVLGVAALFPRTALLGRLPTRQSPEVLAYHARTLATQFDLAKPTATAAHGFALDSEISYHFERDDPDGDWADRPVLPLQLWWRADPRGFRGHEGTIKENDPALETPGETLIVLDARGQLRRLAHHPKSIVPAADPTPPEAPWPELIEQAGLHIDELESTSPQIVPRMYADQTIAWQGTWSDETPVRIEAASTGASLCILSCWVRGVPTSAGKNNPTTSSRP